jgi:uncharacterized protein (DUF362 family)
MGDITASIVREIEDRHAQHPGRPDRELLEHLLVAVQRERVAAVGYDTARLGERLARAPLPERARRAIARAVGQIWLDENMHARYVLGVLLRQRQLGTQLGALAQSAEGGVGGWMTAVEQHTRWADAPGEHLAAALIDAGGRISGRIPEAVRASLTLAPLRSWCAFSLDAEESAVLSFQRMRALAAEVALLPEAALTLPGDFARELERMERDEAAHARIFGALAGMLGDDDGLIDGVPVEALEAALAVDAPPGLAFAAGGAQGALDRPVGGGGRVVVARGARPEDKLETFDRALTDAAFFELIEQRVRALGKRPAEARVVVKIDLMLAWDRSDPSSYVDPELVERLADRLWERGYRDVAVCDAQNIYGRYYANRTVADVGRYVGLSGGHYRLVDLSLEQVPHDFSRAMGVHAAGRTWRDADVRVSFAKQKTHPTAVAQLTLRNVGTVIPQMGEHFFDDRVLDFSALTVAVLHDLPPHFALVDGYAHAADGLLGVLADPTPKHPQLIVAGADALAVDYVTLLLMGERDPARAEDVRACLAWFGDPRPRTEIIGDLTPIPDWDAADAGLLSAPLAALAGPAYASLSGRGALVTADLDPEAFPPLAESGALAAARRALRLVLGMGRRPAR